MFVDINVLVKSRILEAPDHHTARARLERAFQEPEPIRISRQVVREYLEDGPVVTESLIDLCREVSVGGSRFTTPTSWRPCWRMESAGC